MFAAETRANLRAPPRFITSQKTGQWGLGDPGRAPCTSNYSVNSIINSCLCFERLLRARHCAECFGCIVGFNPQSTPVRQVLLSPFYRQGDRPREGMELAQNCTANVAELGLKPGSVRLQAGASATSAPTQK